MKSKNRINIIKLLSNNNRLILMKNFIFEIMNSLYARNNHIVSKTASFKMIIQISLKCLEIETFTISKTVYALNKNNKIRIYIICKVSLPI